jgi:hypothetical protein
MEENPTVNEILECRQEGSGFQISDVIMVWHELIQVRVPLVNISSGGPLHKHQKLEETFE